MANKITIKLSRPVEQMGQTLSEITLKEPSTEDLAETGYPLIFGAKGDTKFDVPVVIALMAKCGGLTPGTVKALSLPDFNAAMMRMMAGFFPDAEDPKAPGGETPSSA